MKKILLLTLEFPPFLGGIAVYLKHVARELGQEYICVLTPPSAKHIQQNSFEDSHEPYTIYRRKLLFPKWLLIPQWVRAVFTTRKIVSKEKPDILMTSHVLPLGYVLLIMKKIKKIPYWINLHGMDVRMAQKSAWKKKWLTKILQGSEMIIVNSEYTKHQVVALEVVDENKINIVYPCPDSDVIATSADIRAKKTQLALEGKNVLFSLGRLVERKGFLRVLQALKIVVEKFPNTVYVIGGEGSQQKELETFMVQNQLQNNVRMVGPVYDEYERAVLYGLSDIFVMTTISTEFDVESFGIVYLEAALQGVPSIASDTGGAREVVQHGTTGIVIQDPVAEQIAEAIIALLENKPFIKQLGKNAQARVQAEFVWSDQVQKIRTSLL